MKVLFLDIDGVVNSEETLKRDRPGGILGIDAYLAFLVGRITLAIPDLCVVLSSSWRHFPKGREQVHSQVTAIYDETPKLGMGTCRGDEIKEWLMRHPKVEKYAILDDDSDMLPEQLPNFFKTTWQQGITPEIVQAVVAHLS